ncbi:N-acetylmuramoyl-L-alanine amidase [Mucilaginibacter sp. BJC16-A38]|uniref:N-acetylmuramoyl-L-alanine amidase n=1 Tax=Mucilaginibacter phenanthrenivorans TaxID=1234842 RepID=UPI002157CC1B|nr:N-acetylmuramoyl-L-alanine amidase [Mucilaginibacter phenanthrenivorans]MCR8561544.1 N-acetylmuramoyl-L-alanine amidase [Mucilaginibacter phenanthrenivorans]
MKSTCTHLLLLFVVFISACSPKGPYALTNKFYKDKTKDFTETIKQELPATLTDSSGMAIPSEFVGTVNFGIRKPNFVIIHFTAQDSVQQTLKTFTVTTTQTSAHYVIAKNGKVFHMVNDYLRANHAGLGKWGSVTDMNSCSIGIEIDNNSQERFTDQQINSLLILLAQLKKAYNIPQANFIGHQDFAPKRKPDPGPLFPWKTLAQHGFGFWSDDLLELPPENFDYTIALKLIGYDTSDLNAAVVAFKRHFVQTDITPQLTQLDLNVLYNVYVKYSGQ